MNSMFKKRMRGTSRMADTTTEAQPVPVWELPAPWQEEQLPEVDRTKHFPTERYWEISKNPDYAFDELDLNNDTVKKVVLFEIRERPDIWVSRGIQHAQTCWPEVAVQTFKKTGVLLSLPSIRIIYKCAKDNLRNRLRYAMVRKRLPLDKVEEYLWGWNYYPYIRYFRQFTQNFEADLLKERADLDKTKQLEENPCEPAKKKTKTAEEKGNQKKITREDNSNEDDDIIWDTPKEAHQSMKHRVIDQPKEEPAPDEAPEQNSPENYRVNPPYYPPGTVFMRPEFNKNYSEMPESTQSQQYIGDLKEDVQNQEYAEDVKHEIQSQHFDEDVKEDIIDQQYSGAVKPELSPVRSICSSTSSSARKNPTRVTDFKEEMGQITFQATRVAGEQPECVRVLRKALFDTVLAFDGNVFGTTKELFKHLYEKS